MFQPSAKTVDEHRKKLKPGVQVTVDLLHRAVPVVHTADGIRALSKDRPISSASVARYLQGKFGDDLERTRHAMQQLARSYPPRDIAQRAYQLYMEFRPDVPAGVSGWGAAGELDLDRVRGLMRR